MKVELPSQLKPQQIELMNSKHLINVMDGGIGTFKTASCILDIFGHCMSYHGQTIVVRANTFEQLSDVFLAEWEEQVSDHLWRYNANKHVIYMPQFDSMLRLRHADYSDRVRQRKGKKGASISGYYYVQAEEIQTETAWQIDDERVRKFGPNLHPAHRCWIDMNPGHPGHWAHELFVDDGCERWMGNLNRPDYPLLWYKNVITTPKTSIYTEDDINKMRLTMRDEVFKRKIMGEWCALEGLVYPFHKTYTGKITPDIVERVWIGLDPGHGGHPFGMIWLAEIKTPSGFQLVIADEHKENLGERGLEYIIPLIEEKTLRLTGGNVDSKPDKLQYGVIDWSDAFYRLNIPQMSKVITQIRHPSHSRGKWYPVMQGVLMLDEAFRIGQIMVHEDCKATKREMNSYTFGDNGEPDKKIYDAHLLDAARYVGIRVLRHGV